MNEYKKIDILPGTIFYKDIKQLSENIDIVNNKIENIIKNGIEDNKNILTYSNISYGDIITIAENITIDKLIFIDGFIKLYTETNGVKNIFYASKLPYIQTTEYKEIESGEQTKYIKINAERKKYNDKNVTAIVVKTNFTEEEKMNIKAEIDITVKYKD